MGRRPFDHAACVEDLTFLASNGVGATEAARRCGFSGVVALDAYLRREGHRALLRRLKYQDWLPIQREYNRRMRMDARAS